MSEYANKKTRGAFIAAVFAMQGFGILFGTIVALVLSAAFRNAYPAPSYYVDAKASLVHEDARDGAVHGAHRPQHEAGRGRHVQGAQPGHRGGAGAGRPPGGRRRRLGPLLAAVPAAPRAAPPSDLHHVVPARHRLLRPEPVPEGHLQQGRVDPAGEDHERHRGAVPHRPRAGAHRALRHHPGLLVHRGLYRHHRQVLDPDHGLRHDDRVRVHGFMLALAEPYEHWTHPAHHTGFVVLYGLTFFFANFGPNSTTFIVPAEIFPARLRSTCHGIPAAAGKAGAIIGAFGFLYAAQDPKKPDAGYSRGIGIRNALFVLAGTNFLGMLMSLLVPESKGNSLEEISKENVDDDNVASV